MKALLKLMVAAILAATAYGDELRVAAAASLAESITEIAAIYQQVHGTKVTPVFAGSNVLARQIEAGAPVDVFISADEKTIADLVHKKLIDPQTVAPLLTNALVIVVRADASLTVNAAEDLTKLSKLSIADPAAVPAGVYAKTWLTRRGLWEKIQPLTVGAENVRGALAAVESGNADAAIVYRTDAAISNQVKIAFTVPKDEAPVIIYPTAICRDSKYAAQAARFVDFLHTEKAAGIFEKRGFTMLAPAVAKP